jgi:hypothetical protein
LRRETIVGIVGVAEAFFRLAVSESW